jgi:PKD repeat protein
VTSWAWTFGDGDTSTSQSPSHTYNTPGTYTVVLKVTGAENDDTHTAVAYIQVDDTPIRGLKIVSPTQLEVGDVGEFAASVTAGTNVAYTWSLGDGAVASGPEITHTYAATGTYSLHLTATNSVGQLTASRSVVVVVDSVSNQEEAIAGLTVSGAGKGLVGQSITFEAGVTAGDNVTYTWDFGDGDEVSTQSLAGGPVITHTYTRAGRFVVTVTAQNSQGRSDVTFPITIDRGLWLPTLRRAG